jgi:hypothetical protein
VQFIGWVKCKKRPRYFEVRFPAHRLDRSSRLGHVVEWIKHHVEEEGGKASFIGYGRADQRTFDRARALLSHEYESQVVFPHYEASGGYHKQRWQVVLMVTHRDAPWPVQRTHSLYAETPGLPAEADLGEATENL